MKVKLITGIGLFVFLFLLTGSASAMSSPNYRLDWLNPLTGGGGGPASSANYAVNFTIGQAAVGTANSTNYGVGLGYWYGVTLGGRLYLPLITR